MTLRELAKGNIECGEQSVEAWKEVKKLLETQAEALK